MGRRRVGGGVTQKLSSREQSRSGRKVSLRGFHTQPPLVTGVDGGDISPIKESQKKRFIVPINLNTKAILPEYSGYLVKWKNCRHKESPVRELEPSGDGGVT